MQEGLGMELLCIHHSFVNVDDIIVSECAMRNLNVNDKTCKSFFEIMNIKEERIICTP